MANDLLDLGDAAERSPAVGDNAPAMSVSELAGAVKKAVEDAFGRVRVRGEIGRVSRPKSGHVYLDLKDERATLSGVIWRGAVAGLGVAPEEGLEVIAEGRLTTFPGQSRYQIVIESLAPAGAGALMAMLEERRKRLAAEGLFDAARKRPPPFLPDVIGVVTSPSGAVIRDILHRLRERFPRRVVLWPVAVQGSACAAEVAGAIHGFNALAPGGPIPRPDVLIVARGGGSVEDLWGFNEEAVVRAAAASDIPLIAAVGHETDVTLIDFAADLRAPTPTAAAEMAAPVRVELVTRLEALNARLRRNRVRDLERRWRDLGALARALPRVETLLGPARQRFDASVDRLPLALTRFTRGLDGRLGRVAGRLAPSLLRGRVRNGVERARMLGDRLRPGLTRLSVAARRDFARARLATRLALAAQTVLRRRLDAVKRTERLLTTLSYKATLRRGYVAVRGPDGLAARATSVSPGDAVTLEFADAARQATIVESGVEASPERASGSARESAPRRDSPPSTPLAKRARRQGELF